MKGERQPGLMSAIPEKKQQKNYLKKNLCVNMKQATDREPRTHLS